MSAISEQRSGRLRRRGGIAAIGYPISENSEASGLETGLASQGQKKDENCLYCGTVFLGNRMRNTGKGIYSQVRIMRRKANAMRMERNTAGTRDGLRLP